MSGESIRKAARRSAGLAALATTIAAAWPALAEPEAAQVGEVIVTAQKREEAISTVPLAISALTGRDLEARNIDNLVELSGATPGLAVYTGAQSAGVALRLRGVGTSSNAAVDPSVAAYVDGAYVPRPGAILATFLDIDTVEVLRGPQGTLFGRNATAGALSIRTRRPDLTRASASAAVQVGGDGGLRGEAVINAPVSESLAFRAAGLVSHTDGAIHNRLDGGTYGAATTREARLSMLWRPSARLTWLVRADYALTTGDGVALNQVDTASATPAQLAAFAARLGGAVPTLSAPPSFTVNQLMTDPRLRDRQASLTSQVDYRVGAGYALRFISALQDWRNRQRDGDIGFTPLDLLSRNAAYRSRALSQEIQLISPKHGLLGGRMDFVAGLYASRERYALGQVDDLGAQYCGVLVRPAAGAAAAAACQAAPRLGAAETAFRQTAVSLAAYAQATFALAPRLDLLLGARDTHDRKRATFRQTLANPGAILIRAPEQAALSLNDERPSWRATLDWRIAPGVLAFATYSTGYKSGGFNSSPGSVALGPRRAFGAETAKNWEAGLKGAFLDRRLSLAATAYRMRLDNFQERSFDGSGFVVRNAGDLLIRGLELEGKALPTPYLRIEASGAYLHSEFASNHAAPGLPGCTGAAGSCPLVQDLTGRRSTFAPAWQATVAAEFDTPPMPGELIGSLRVEAQHTSSYDSTTDLNPQGRIAAATTYGARLTLARMDGRWSLSLFGDNLSDERLFTTKFAQPQDAAFGVRNPATGATLMRGFVAPRRTWGVRLAASR